MFHKVNYPPINGIDDDKVNRIVSSILENGWIGAPILYHEGIGLITGSHRVKALERIFDMYDSEELTAEQMRMAEQVDYEGDYAMDVTEIVDMWMDETGEDVEFDNLGVIFEGTKIEKYKNEIPEWD